MNTRSGPTREDIGTAMLVWYAEAARTFRQGLVTQAQAAVMLAVNRMAASRLVARGHLQAVHFPRPPDVAGVAVGRDDPIWQRIADQLALDPDGDVRGLPKACYVSFADVVRLWQAAPAGRGCRPTWRAALLAAGLTEAARALPGESAPGEGEPETWML